MESKTTTFDGSFSGKFTPDNTKKLIPVLVNRESMIQINIGNDEKGAFNPSNLIVLASGMNFVDEERWNKALKNPGVRTLCTTKSPPANAPEENPERVGKMIIEHFMPVSADNPLKDLNEDDALRYVSETLVVPTLRTLEKQESRPLLLRAIRGQIDRIEKPKQEARKNQAKE